MKPLKITYCKFLPLQGFGAMTLFNYIIVRTDRKDKPLSETTINHETIHQHQAYDFGIGFFGYFIFYILYLLEGLGKLPSVLFGKNPYKSISFEQEAYANATNFEYLNSRKKFNGIKNIFKFV